MSLGRKPARGSSVDSQASHTLRLTAASASAGKAPPFTDRTALLHPPRHRRTACDVGDRITVHAASSPRQGEGRCRSQRPPLSSGCGSPWGDRSTTARTETNRQPRWPSKPYGVVSMGIPSSACMGPNTTFVVAARSTSLAHLACRSIRVEVEVPDRARRIPPPQGVRLPMKSSFGPERGPELDPVCIGACRLKVLGKGAD